MGYTDFLKSELQLLDAEENALAACSSSYGLCDQGASA